MIEASLSKPHTSVTALQDVYVCQLLVIYQILNAHLNILNVLMHLV